MKRSKSIRMALGLALLALSAMIAPSSGSDVDFTNAAFVQPTGETSIPFGHAEFCAERSSECTDHGQVVDAVPLTERLWNQLLSVNAGINAEVVPVTDADLYKTEEFWTYPRGYGDCEDFVLAKRRDLIALGWPESTFLITVVKELNGAGHAVLLVRTDRGDLVLDNQESLVKLWNQTPYQYVKRQSQGHAGRWVGLADTRPTQLLASL